MKRSIIAPFALCFLLALLVAAPVSIGADKPPKELWDEFPLDATPEPTPSAEAPSPTPAPSAQPQQRVVSGDDGGGGMATPALLALLIGAAGLGGAAVFMASRRMTGPVEGPAPAPVARTGRFVRHDEPEVAPVARANGHPLDEAVAAEKPPKPHPVSRAKAARRAKHAKREPDKPRSRRTAGPGAGKPRRRPKRDAPPAEAPANGAVPHDELPAVPPPAKSRRRRAAKAEATHDEPRAVEADDEAIAPAAAAAGHDEPAAPAEPAHDEAAAADAAAATPERESRPSRRRRGAWKRTSDEPASRRERKADVAAERVKRPRPQPRPVPVEPVAEVEAEAEAYPACRIKFHNRPIRTHFYAVPYEGGPVLARSPYFKLERGKGDSGPTAPEALRALVEDLTALGWQQTGVGSAPWDLRFQRSTRVVQRRG